MNILWNTVWEAHPDIFIVRDWQECPADKRKAWRLPPQFAYYMGGETSLRVGIIASNSPPREEDFLLAGMMWGNRLSNGAKTLIYFVAPDYTPSFFRALAKIGGNISVRAVYWRERLNPSLYLIPESNAQVINGRYSLGEERPDWERWGKGLNPVARQQLNVVKEFFESLQNRRILPDFRQGQIVIQWGNVEIAEIKRKGKKFELMTKVKWAKDSEQASLGQRLGWVDAAGRLNIDFCNTVQSIIGNLESMENRGEIRTRDLLSLRLKHGEGILTSLWGNVWLWPWLARDKGESWINDLSQWHYFQGNGQLSIICPIIGRPLSEACQSIMLTCILDSGILETGIKNRKENISWDGRVHWLTLSSLEEELRRWHSWLKEPERFPIWVLPENWRNQGLEELACRST